jgi:hypothetical protein
MSGTDYTPTEAAHDIAMGWLANAFKDKTSDLNDYAGRNATKARMRALRKAIAKLHNFLLDRSGLDGLPLELDEDK